MGALHSLKTVGDVEPHTWFFGYNCWLRWLVTLIFFASCSRCHAGHVGAKKFFLWLSNFFSQGTFFVFFFLWLSNFFFQNFQIGRMNLILLASWSARRGHYTDKFSWPTDQRGGAGEHLKNGASRRQPALAGEKMSEKRWNSVWW